MPSLLSPASQTRMVLSRDTEARLLDGRHEMVALGGQKQGRRRHRAETTTDVVPGEQAKPSKIPLLGARACEREKLFDLAVVRVLRVQAECGQASRQRHRTPGHHP